MAISERYLLDILQKQKALLEAILTNLLPSGSTLSYGSGDCGEFTLTVHPPMRSSLGWFSRLLIWLKLKKEPAGPIMMATPEVNEYVIREGGTTSIVNPSPDSLPTVGTLEAEVQPDGSLRNIKHHPPRSAHSYQPTWGPENPTPPQGGTGTMPVPSQSKKRRKP